VGHVNGQIVHSLVACNVVKLDTFCSCLCLLAMQMEANAEWRRQVSLQQL